MSFLFRTIGKVQSSILSKIHQKQTEPIFDIWNIFLLLYLVALRFWKTSRSLAICTFVLNRRFVFGLWKASSQRHVLFLDNRRMRGDASQALYSTVELSRVLLRDDQRMFRVSVYTALSFGGLLHIKHINSLLHIKHINSSYSSGTRS